MKTKAVSTRMSLPMLMLLMGMGPCGPDHDDMGHPADMAVAGGLDASRGTPDLGRGGSDGGSMGGSLCPAPKMCWPLAGQISKVWGRDSTDMWAVGAAGLTAHFDGTTWTKFASPVSVDLAATWNASPTDAWAVGTGGTVIHWNGAAWSTVPSGITTDLMGVWGSSSADVWAMTSRSTGVAFSPILAIFHWTGASWTAVTVSATSGSDGGSPTRISAFAGCAANEIYAVGTEGSEVTVKWDGQQWHYDEQPISSSTITGVYCSGPGQAWFTTNQAPQGATVAYLTGPVTSDRWVGQWDSIGGLVGGGPNDVWAQTASLIGGPRNTLHWDGTKVQVISPAIQGPQYLDAPGSWWNWDGSMICHSPCARGWRSA